MRILFDRLPLTLRRTSARESKRDRSFTRDEVALESIIETRMTLDPLSPRCCRTYDGGSIFQKSRITFTVGDFLRADIRSCTP